MHTPLMRVIDRWVDRYEVTDNEQEVCIVQTSSSSSSAKKQQNMHIIILTMYGIQWIAQLNIY